MKTIIRFFVAGSFVLTQFSIAQWVQTGNPTGAAVICFAEDTISGGNNLFAGTTEGIYLSTDNGSTWKEVNDGLPTRSYINAIAISPGSSGNGTNIFAGTMGGGVFLSTNNGTSWSAVNTGFSMGYYNFINAFTLSGSNLFAGTGGGVYLSTNNGTTWVAVNNGIPRGSNISCFAVHGANLYAGGKGIYLSTNNGTSWSLLGPGLDTSYVLSLIFAGNNFISIENTLTNAWMEFFDYKLKRSTDEGTNWHSSVMKGFIYNGWLVPLEVSGTNIFAGAGYYGMRSMLRSRGADTEYSPGTDTLSWSNGVYLSIDGGANWSAVDSGLANNAVSSLAVSGTYLFAGTVGNGIWRRPLSEMIPATDSLLVPVAGGTFTAGSTLTTISSFNIDKFEITYELWTDVRTWALTHGYTDLWRGQNGSSPVGANNPVTMVNWYDVVKWYNARSEKDGLTPVYYTRSAQDTVYRAGQIDFNNDAVKWTANGYRLPTEAEWEFAAKGGTFAQKPTPYAYSGSNTIGDVAWYYSNSGGATHTVGTKQPNELGIYDMSGNVDEWCWDWYGSAYPSGGTTDPKGPAKTQTYRLSSGGPFYGAPPNCQVAYRSWYHDVSPSDRDLVELGFRSVQGSQVGTAVKSETRTPQTFGLAQRCNRMSQ
ncbi:MAG: SUMF1/EgtB/PvdO family nonheme iron enzyme [Ignavibacteriales bacterium]|nr:SUMF1/EgtB/PvdO family nonheme iron enzyme [Ignavibacteriales bacterium]